MSRLLRTARRSGRAGETKRSGLGSQARFLMILTGSGLILLGLLLGFQCLNSSLQQMILSRERYLYDFHAIVCPCPPGSDRLSFLAEVRYLSQHPPRFSVLSPDLTENLRRAFTSHPWVAEVRSVTILPGQVCVDLRFRTPMLQVVLIQGPPRWVDESGVLLPSLVPHQQRDAPVAVLLTPRQSPTTPAGQRWEDPVVLQALALVRAYQPRQLEFRQRYWELTLANGQTLYVTGQSWE